MRLLDRYLLGRLVSPFLVGVLTFAVILVGDEARKLGQMLAGQVPFGLILRYLWYATPQALSWSLPVGTLVGVAMATTSQARAGESVAMRCGGAGFGRICRPFFLFALAATAVTYWITEAVAPGATQRSTAVLNEMTYSQPVMHQQRDVFFSDGDRRVFSVRFMNADRKELQGVSVFEFDQRGRPQTLTAAKRARLEGRERILQDGWRARLTANGQPIYPLEHFSSTKVVLWEALQRYYTESRTPFEMGIGELSHLASTVGASGGDTAALATQLQFKLSIPLACLIFALLAAPLADRYAHHGAFAGILIAIIAVFLYNGVRSWGLALGLSGAISPVIAGWSANVVFGVIGGVLMWRHR